MAWPMATDELHRCPNLFKKYPLWGRQCVQDVDCEVTGTYEGQHTAAVVLAPMAK
jgi:hypothetical protein